MSLLFDASNEVVDFGSPTSLDDIQVGTWAAWILPTSFLTDREWMQKDDNASWYTWHNFCFADANGNMLYIYHRSSTDLQVKSSGNPLSLSVWQYVVATFNGGGANSDQHLYLGTLSTQAAECSYAVQVVGSGGFLSDANYNLGVGNRLPANFNFPGKVAWVAIWNSVLSLAEVRMQQFNLWAPVKASNSRLFCHLGFNGAGTQIDWSGNQNNGTLSNATVDSHVPIHMPLWKLPWEEPSQPGTTLTVQDVSCTTQTDNVVLSGIAITLVVQDAFCTTQADNVPMGQITLTVQDAYVTTQVEKPALGVNLQVSDIWIEPYAEHVSTPARVRVTWVSLEIPPGVTSTLSVQDASCVTQVDAVAVTKQSTLVVQDASCTSQVDAVVVAVGNIILAVQDASCVTQVDSPAITKQSALVVQDASCTTQTDAVTLTQVHNLTPADSYCITFVESIVLAGPGSLTVQDASCVTQTDSVVLTQVHNLTVADVYSATQVDAVTTTKQTTLVVADAYSTSQVDVVSLSGAINLVVADLYSTSQVDGVATTKQTTLAGIADAYCTSQVDAVATTKQSTLAIADAHCTSFVETVTVYGPGALSIQDAHCVTYLESPKLTQVHNLHVDDAYTTSQVDVPVVTKQTTLTGVADAYTTSQVDTFKLTKETTVVTADVFCTTQTDTLKLTQAHNLAVADLFSATQSETFVLTQVHNLHVGDAYCVATVEQIYFAIIAKIVITLLTGRKITGTLLTRNVTGAFSSRTIDIELEEV